jgi:hypothetical protein
MPPRRQARRGGELGRGHGVVTGTLLRLRSHNHERRAVMGIGLLCEATLLKRTVVWR